MSSAVPTSSLRQLLENRLSQLSAEVEGLFAEVQERGRTESAGQLNQAVRRIRQSADVDELCATLADAAGEYYGGAALFLLEGGIARGERIRGVSEENAEHFREMEIPLAAAPALAGAVQSRDPVIAVTAASEVSARMVALAEHESDGRVSIFPVVVRDGVPALVYAWGRVQGSAIELLAQVAGAIWSELSKPPAPAASPVVSPELVQIAPAVESAADLGGAPNPPDTRPASAWDSLSAQEQMIHLRAQRYARVQVAEMRLYEPDAVQSGRAERKLYHVLRKQIDAGREEFRRDFFAPCPSMVDYFHLELVRTLANDDAEMLGKEYPGPMV